MHATDGHGTYIEAFRFTDLNPETTAACMLQAEAAGWTADVAPDRSQITFTNGPLTLILARGDWLVFDSDFGQPVGDPRVVSDADMTANWRQVGI